MTNGVFKGLVAITLMIGVYVAQGFFMQPSLLSERAKHEAADVSKIEGDVEQPGSDATAGKTAKPAGAMARTSNADVPNPAARLQPMPQHVATAAPTPPPATPPTSQPAPKSPAPAQLAATPPAAPVILNAGPASSNGPTPPAPVAAPAPSPPPAGATPAAPAVAATPQAAAPQPTPSAAAPQTATPGTAEVKAAPGLAQAVPAAAAPAQDRPIPGVATPKPAAVAEAAAPTKAPSVLETEDLRAKELLAAEHKMLAAQSPLQTAEPDYNIIVCEAGCGAPAAKVIARQPKALQRSAGAPSKPDAPAPLNTYECAAGCDYPGAIPQRQAANTVPAALPADAATWMTVPASPRPSARTTSPAKAPRTQTQLRDDWMARITRDRGPADAPDVKSGAPGSPVPQAADSPADVQHPAPKT